MARHFRPPITAAFKSLAGAVILSLVLAMTVGHARADVPATAGDFTLDSISLAGANLVFSATIPPGVAQVILETHSSLDSPWVPAGQWNVPSGGGEMNLTIPKPATPTAFFRLKAGAGATNTGLISSEFQYVTLPSLATRVDTNGDAIFHFKGEVDGSDRILITRAGALWSHVNWGWPQDAVTINDHPWSPQQKNYLTTVESEVFLPGQFSLSDVKLEKIRGRDVIALERVNAGLLVILDDTPNAADTYEFKIHFHPAQPESVKKTASPVATLKIAGRIDGSDCIKITATEARWEHQMRSGPQDVTINNLPWDTQAEPVRKNEAARQFLPAGVDLSTAKIVSRRGRDLATMWSDADALWVQFADNPNGVDDYQIEISFGR